jgi:hypothetical protein
MAGTGAHTVSGMTDPFGAHDDTVPTVDRSGYELEVEDRFEDRDLDEGLWIPRYLPHWTRRSASITRYEAGAGRLVLRIDEDQPPWSQEYTGELRVSSLQTGVFSGPKGSGIGQHRWRDGLLVREEQPAARLYTPMYGLFEVRARFGVDPTTMAALWMIGYEDEPERSAEICIAEIFGRDVRSNETGIGMGVHPFHDPTIRDEFATVLVPIDARESHTYAAAWTPESVAFYVDDTLAKVVRQSPAYPMQFMLDIFEFRGAETAPAEGGPYPKTFVVESFRGYRPVTRSPWRRNAVNRTTRRDWT